MWYVWVGTAVALASYVVLLRWHLREEDDPVEAGLGAVAFLVMAAVLGLLWPAMLLGTVVGYWVARRNR